ncbi:MAG: hypothetical protein IJC56_11670 [Clostridia bacterium]|nr:hypothetical protein [Clostridia bacterium]
MRVRISYKNYPLSQKLTNKSLRVATLTRPLIGMCIGILPGLASAVLLPNSLTLPLVLMFGGMAAGLILAPIIRKKIYAKMDAEYESIVQAYYANFNNQSTPR